MKTPARSWMLALVLPFAIALAGCEGAEAPDEPEEVTTAGDPAGTLEAELVIDDVTVGTALADDGSIDAAATDDEVAAGEPIYVAMEVGDAHAGDEVRVVWYGPAGAEVHSETKQVTLDQHYLNFMADTTGWEVGTYRGEVWYGNEMTNEFEFEVLEPAAAT